MPSYRWEQLPSVPPEVVAAFSDYPSVIAQLFFNRGIRDRRGARQLLTEDSAPAYDPFTLPDMTAAVDFVIESIAHQYPITVFGDFDADGITGTALLVQGLSKLGAVVSPYIPHRDEGYGLNVAALEELRSQGVRLVLTVDTGTSAVDEIARAREIGLRVVVLDHHAIPMTLPQADAIVNPYRAESRYPFPDLSGAGTAFKLLQAVEQSLKATVSDDVYDLAAIGTVADLAPLQEENRWIVQRGLDGIHRRTRTGLAALLARAGLPPDEVRSEDLGFIVAPRINAMGRLEHAMASYQLLQAADLAEANPLADQLESTNRLRQQMTIEMVAAARIALDGAEQSAPLAFTSSPEYPAGIIGLIASRLAEEWYRPAIAVAEGPELSRGSARSIPGVSIVDLLRECRDLMVRYGGHPAAAGFTIETHRLPELRERVTALAAEVVADIPRQAALTIGASTPLRDIPGKTLSLLSKLAPFGAGNPEPLFLTPQLRVLDVRTFGADGAHLELKLGEERTTWKAVGFGMGGRAVRVGEVIDAVYSVGNDRFDGHGMLQLRLRDFRTTGGESPSP